MLIFDFDGVLINSIDEVAVTAFNAVSGSSLTSLEELPPGYLSIFRLNRHWVLAAGDYLVFGKWCIENCSQSADKRLIGSEYDIIRRECEEPLLSRTKKFFETRAQFLEKDRVKWLELNSPYQPLVDELSRMPGYSLLIVTNKNSSAVLELCAHFRIRIKPDDVYSGDDGVSKSEHIRNITKRFGDSTYYFVDDSIHNLMELEELQADLPLHLLLASWGYCGPDDIDCAQGRGIKVVSQKDVLDLLDRLLKQ